MLPEKQKADTLRIRPSLVYVIFASRRAQAPGEFFPVQVTPQ
jgi:hypothetical protein